MTNPPPIRAAFWMVCRSPRGPNAKTAPTQRYSTRADAAQAAQALADQTGEIFTLLAAVESIHPRGNQSALF